MQILFMHADTGLVVLIDASGPNYSAPSSAFSIAFIGIPMVIPMVSPLIKLGIRINNRVEFWF